MTPLAQCPSRSAMPSVYRNARASISDIADRKITRRSPDPSHKGSIICQPTKCAIPAATCTMIPSTCTDGTISGSVNGYSRVAKSSAALAWPSLGGPLAGKPMRLPPILSVLQWGHSGLVLWRNCDGRNRPRGHVSVGQSVLRERTTARMGRTTYRDPERSHCELEEVR